MRKKYLWCKEIIFNRKANAKYCIRCYEMKTFMNIKFGALMKALKVFVKEEIDKQQCQ